MTNKDDNASLPEMPVEVFPYTVYAPYHTATHHLMSQTMPPDREVGGGPVGPGLSPIDLICL